MNPSQGKDRVTPVSPRLSGGSDIRAKGVWPWQRADKLQVDGLEDVHRSIGAPTEDGVFRQRQRVGHTSLKAGHKCHLVADGSFHPITGDYL